MFETVFDMGLLPGQRLQSPKLRFSGLMLLPNGVKDGQFERIGLFRSNQHLTSEQAGYIL